MLIKKIARTIASRSMEISMEILKKLSAACAHLQKPSLYLLKILFEGIVIGIVTGLIVSYLFATPSISLTDTAVKRYDDKNQVRIELKNSGQTEAQNVLLNVFFGYEDADPKTFRRIQPKVVELIDAGDVFSYKTEEFPKSTGEKNVIVLLLVTYEDSNGLRQLVNRVLLGNDYKMMKWMVHIKGKDMLSAVTSRGKEKYKVELIERMKSK
jgi:hypothetical protein